MDDPNKQKIQDAIAAGKDAASGRTMIPPPLRWGTFPDACNAGIARHGEAAIWRRLSDGEDAPLSDHADNYTGGSVGEWAFDDTRLLYRRRTEETPSERFVLL